MDTDALIEQLSRGSRPVPPRLLQRRLAASLAAGGGVSAAMLAVLGVPTSPSPASVQAASWFLAACMGGLGISGLLLTAQLARPECRRPGFLWLPALPFAATLMLAVDDLARSDIERPLESVLTFGLRAVALMAALSVPIFTGLMWAMRRMAPTRLRAAGAAAGLTAGGFAAALHASSAASLGPAYAAATHALAAALAAVAGAVLGRRLLNW